MTLTEFSNIFDDIQIPVAYHHFKEKQNTPYIVYMCDGDNDLMADNEHYIKIHEGYIELYIDKKDPQKENEVANCMKNNHIAYKKENEDYIETEDVFYVRWSFSFI